jgi:hypothetical protein
VGRRLETWPLTVTTVGAALAAMPRLVLLRSRPHWKQRLFGWMTRRSVRGEGWLPPFFRSTMSDMDSRRPPLEHGLGVVVEGRARYYPLTAARQGLQDSWAGRDPRVTVSPQDGVPQARWEDTGERPFQLFTRWYGFSFTYPGCEIHGEPRAEDSLIR